MLHSFSADGAWKRGFVANGAVLLVQVLTAGAVNGIVAGQSTSAQQEHENAEEMWAQGAHYGYLCQFDFLRAG